MVANVGAQKVELNDRDSAACVVKAVKFSYLYVTAFMTSTLDARNPENVSKLRQISNLMLRQKWEFITAADWGSWRPRVSCV